MQERREGNSRLVYDKAQRTIVTVTKASEADKAAYEAGLKTARKLDRPPYTLEYRVMAIVQDALRAYRLHPENSPPPEREPEDDDKCPDCNDAGFVGVEPCLNCNKLFGI